MYFSAMVSAMHINNGKSGNISIADGGVLNGVIFSIYLP
jgi:hypothetical protein